MSKTTGDFMPNVVLNEVKQAITKLERRPSTLRFDFLAKNDKQGARLQIGSTCLCLSPTGKLGYQWEFNAGKGARFTAVQLPAFEDPKFDPQAVIDFAIHLYTSKLAASDLANAQLKQVDDAFATLGAPTKYW